eukprot:1486930-Rhodomonas_salina.4
MAGFTSRGAHESTHLTCGCAGGTGDDDPVWRAPLLPDLQRRPLRAPCPDAPPLSGLPAASAPPVFCF